jgi:hypothetical protein
MVPGDQVMLRPTHNAKGRTKNRLREHGELGFIVKRTSIRVRCLDNLPALLLESVTKNSSGGIPWCGWLPCEEIEKEVDNV